MQLEFVYLASTIYADACYATLFGVAIMQIAIVTLRPPVAVKSLHVALA